jgi:hypothetical protein
MAVQCASFPMGNIVITPNALGQLTPADVQLGLQRHQAGDWGDLGEEDWKENYDAVVNGRRLLSSYPMVNSGEGQILVDWRFMAKQFGAKKNPAAVALGRLGGLKGGPARTASMTPAQTLHGVEVVHGFVTSEGEAVGVHRQVARPAGDAGREH